MTNELDARRRRVTLNFDIKYEHMGGTKKLIKLAEQASNVEDIATFFGNISGKRISKILESVLGMQYSTYLKQRGISKVGLYARKDTNEPIQQAR